MDFFGGVDFLLVTGNCGSVFEDPSRLLECWIKEFLTHVNNVKPAFIALHLQEVGGKTYEKSMEYVQEFIKVLCESDGLKDYNRIRVYLDEDYNSAEHFTALGNLYFAIKSINNIKIWNFLTHEYESVEGKSIHTGNIESIATKEKAKFPQQFFPECKWSRKGFLRTRWVIEGTTLDLINIHLFHDASNLAAAEEFPSVYCKSRRRALVHTLERFHKDSMNELVPFFIFGDFNFRCDTAGVVNKLTEDLTEHRIPHLKPDHSKVQYRDSDGGIQLTLGKKEFTHIDHQIFREKWMQEFDRELDPIREILFEFPITFPPSYPFEEEPDLPHNYMTTRCPSWCDRILLSKTAKKLMDDEENYTYGIIGEDVCMGDHKPVYLSLRIKTKQGISNICEHAQDDRTNKENISLNSRSKSSNASCLFSNYSTSSSNLRRLHDPYTPEDSETHSPQPEYIDEKEFPIINETTDSDEILENIHKLNSKKVSQPVLNVNDEELRQTPEISDDKTSQHNHQNHNHISHTVSPRQLKSRLEILRRESGLGSDPSSIKSDEVLQDEIVWKTKIPDLKLFQELMKDCDHIDEINAKTKYIKFNQTSLASEEGNGETDNNNVEATGALPQDEIEAAAAGVADNGVIFRETTV
ncbi:unnamed protein product [Diamesa hyperborea]